MADKNKILIVDDDPTLRLLLTKELTTEGYETTTAADGDDAIDLLKVNSYDLVLLDIFMPRVPGFEVLKYIKKEVPGVKVIMLTAFADLKNAIESKRLGAEDFISKPYDLVDLLSTMERVLMMS